MRRLSRVNDCDNVSTPVRGYSKSKERAGAMHYFCGFLSDFSTFSTADATLFFSMQFFAFWLLVREVLLWNKRTYTTVKTVHDLFVLMEILC